MFTVFAEWKRVEIGFMTSGCLNVWFYFDWPRYWHSDDLFIELGIYLVVNLISTNMGESTENFDFSVSQLFERSHICCFSTNFLQTWILFYGLRNFLPFFFHSFLFFFLSFFLPFFLAFFYSHWRNGIRRDRTIFFMSKNQVNFFFVLKSSL